MSLRIIVLALCAAGLVVGCGGSGGGSDRVTSGDFAFEVEFRGAKPTDKDVYRGGEVRQPPAGSSWYAFELRIKNVSHSNFLSANTPDVGIACGAETAEQIEALNDPGFILGEPAYATSMLDNGASNTGVVPLAVPNDATNCRFVVKIDKVNDVNSRPLEYAFQK